VASERQAGIIRQPVSTRTLVIVQIVPANRLHIQPDAGLRSKVLGLTGETVGCPFVYVKALNNHVIHGRTSGIMSELVRPLEVEIEAAGKTEFEASCRGLILHIVRWRA